MKRKVSSLILALILVLSLLPAGALAESSDSPQSFDDVASSEWYYSAVQYAAQNGLMTGASDKSFEPEAAMTRAMLSTVLYRMEGSKKADKLITFTDVSSSVWYCDAVNWAAANGIADGYGDSVFGPEDNVTREQMAAIFQRYAKYKLRNTDNTADTAAYTDASQISDWAKSAMNWAIYTGLINGTDSSTLSPGDCATRAQTAAILMRYINGSTLEKRGFDYVSQFIKGDLDTFYKDSDDAFKKSITLENFISGWNNVIQIVGTPESFTSTYAKKNGYDYVVNSIKAVRYDIIITISFYPDGKPGGIGTTLAPKDPPKPQSTDKWEEVAVKVGEKELPGLLTLPKNIEKPPVVILVHGSGSSDMNETLGTAPNRPFEDIAHGLAEQGVATLRYNKRTYQYPTTRCDTIQYETLDDAGAAAKLLASDSRVDANRIYLLGHSLGGMMAPKITADNTQIKGFISMAGSLRPLREISMDQNKAGIWEEPSLTNEQKEALLAQAKAVLDKTKTLEDGGTGYIAGLPTSYWKSLNEVDGAAIVKGLNVPMLILQGSADFQIYADKDYKLWQTTLEGRSNVDFKLYDGLSHLFMPNQVSPSGVPDITLYNAPNHIASQVITDIASWVNKQ